MFTRKWSTSERKYDVTVERDVRVRMPDGTLLDGNIYRPASSERFPVILGAHPYNKDLQPPPLRPVGFTPMRGYMESGDPTFFARRGYVHAVFNVRGTGKSEGFYQLLGPVEIQDICDLIDWLAAQPWSSGQVGMFGVSYFAKLAKAVAAANPKPLTAAADPGPDHHPSRRVAPVAHRSSDHARQHHRHLLFRGGHQLVRPFALMRQQRKERILRSGRFF